MKIRVVYCKPDDSPRVMEMFQAKTLVNWLIEQTKKELEIRIIRVQEIPD